MVFSTVPVYLDPPNWQQQPNHHHQPQRGGGIVDSQLPLPPLPPIGGSGGVGTGVIRPNSTAVRARMAKVLQPEAALKCPRCESTNTKFCYFNNYSLSQPRYFCKTCRRYWTRGGALRNVPVGGGCRRRNKRSKGSSRSKSPAVTEGQATAGASSSSAFSSSIIGGVTSPQQQIPILPTLHHQNDYNSGDIGLNFWGIQAQCGASNGNGIGFQVANGSNGGSILSCGLGEQWKLQQVQHFPFLSTGLEQANGLYSLDSESVEPQSCNIGQLRPKPALDAGATQLATVKMEENTQRLNFSRIFSGNINSGNDEYWGSNNIAWTDLSGFTPPSTTHIL